MWLLSIDWTTVIICFFIVALVFVMCFLAVWLVTDANRQQHVAEADEKKVAELEGELAAEKKQDAPKT